MKHFIIHDANGKILRTGSCPDDHIELQAQAGEIAIEGVANDIKHYIANGALVEYPAKPDSHHEWDWSKKKWGKPADYAERVAKENSDAWNASRSGSYPPLTDLADALYWQSKGDNTKMADYLAKCEAVKAVFPKV